MEKELQESEKKLSQIIEGSSTPIFVIDKNHIVTHWNKACEKLTGVSAKNITNTKKHWIPFYSTERPLLADVIVDNLTEKEIAKFYNNKFKKSALIEGAYDCEDFYPDLDNKWLFFTAAPLRDNQENIIGAIETLRDITEQKQAEELLKKSEARLRQIIDTVPHMIFAKDRDGRFIMANKTVADGCGTTPENMVGKIHPELLGAIRSQKVLRRQKVRVLMIILKNPLNVLSFLKE